jgi:putative MFS transporter
LMIRAWVPESPRWLIRRGRREEARRSIAWALQIDSNKIELPAALPELQHTRWRELFKYPRNLVASADGDRRAPCAGIARAARMAGRASP